MAEISDLLAEIGEKLPCCTRHGRPDAGFLACMRGQVSKHCRNAAESGDANQAVNRSSGSAPQRMRRREYGYAQSARGAERCLA